MIMVYRNTHTDGYDELYIAIWKQAIKDESKKQGRRLLRECLKNMFSFLPDKQDERWNVYAKIEHMMREHGKINEFRIIEKSIERNRERLEKAIQKKIYRESQKWPKGMYEKDILYEHEYSKMRCGIENEMEG